MKILYQILFRYYVESESLQFYFNFWTSHRYKFKWSSQLFSLFRSNIHLWLPPPMNGTLSCKPSAWDFVLRWQSKTNISNWSSLWAAPLPCPWTSTRAGRRCQQRPSKDQGKAHLLSGMQNAWRNLASINQSSNQVYIWELMRGKNYVCVCVF